MTWFQFFLYIINNNNFGKSIIIICSTDKEVKCDAFHIQFKMINIISMKRYLIYTVPTSEWKRQSEKKSHELKLQRIGVGFAGQRKCIGADSLWRSILPLTAHCFICKKKTWTSSNFYTIEWIKSETSQINTTTTTFSSIPPTVHLTLWPNNNNKWANTLLLYAKAGSLVMHT